MFFARESVFYFGFKFYCFDYAPTRPITYLPIRLPFTNGLTNGRQKWSPEYQNNWTLNLFFLKSFPIKFTTRLSFPNKTKMHSKKVALRQNKTPGWRFSATWRISLKCEPLTLTFPHKIYFVSADDVLPQMFSYSSHAQLVKYNLHFLQTLLQGRTNCDFAFITLSCRMCGDYAMSTKSAESVVRLCNKQVSVAIFRS